ncbi:hypothetical protein D3C72_426260 [compost metagenome]
MAAQEARDVGQLILVGQFAVEQAVHPFDDLVQQRLFLFVDAARADFGHAGQLGSLAGAEGQVALALALQAVVRQLDAGQVHALALAAEGKQRQQAAVEDRPLFQVRVAVVDDLAEEAVEAQERAHVPLEQVERRHVIQCIGRRLGVAGGQGGGAGLLGSVERLQQPVGDGFQRGDQLRLLGLGIQLDLHHPLDVEVVVMARAVQLGAQVEDHVGVGRALQLGRLIIGLERRQDVVRAVHEVQDVGRVFARVRPV